MLTVAALLTHCRLLVANDSGPLHLGLALGVPTIALIGADDPRRVGPYGVDWGVALHKRQEVCTEEPCRLKKCPKNVCLEAITVAEVVEMIKTWWEPQYVAGVRGRKKFKYNGQAFTRQPLHQGRIASDKNNSVTLPLINYLIMITH